ncbi:hypothetical protein RclHR1_17290005 [Rhizophagus clarus]|uniref:Phosphatidylglycerol/phosphatidylinositol transfer protein n=1 Tax=Rhizophagus clarus TaxID=94130 RepID=A0A2Z6QNQ6_9GLOM|nr:hypothetical protein RclHR1_17290005 [Rhizophagus clarus]GES73155.1 hypothetical protein GLOIN_2v1632724 [Rhizophagus clarus]
MTDASQLSQCSGNYPDPVIVTIIPDPPVFGQNIQFIVSLVPYITVEVGAFVDIQVNKPDMIIPFSVQQDICNDNYVNCPIPASNQQYHYTSPTYFLNGTESFTTYVKARLVNPDNTILSCVEGIFTILGGN